MAITNIGTLQDAVESWMERTFDDALFLEWANDVAGVLMRGVLDPGGRTWICPPLRTRDMLTSTTLATSNTQASLPADWLEFERIWIDANDGADLTFIPLTQFRTHPYVQQSGTPTSYTIDGDTLFTLPTSDATLQISYYQTLGGFTGDSDDDVVLLSDPGLYRMGVMAEACDWIQDYERAQIERAKFYARVRGLNAQTKLASQSGALLVAQPPLGSVA